MTLMTPHLRGHATTAASTVLDSANGTAPRSIATSEAPVPPVPMPRGQTASPLQTIGTLRGLESEMDGLLGSGDLATMMAALATRIRRHASSAMTAEAAAASTQRSVEVSAQIEAFQKAAQSQKEAQTWGLVGRIAAYIAAAVSVAVGVCASVFSGGSSLLAGIALAAVCISAAASATVMAAQDLGAFGNQPPPRWLTILIAVVALIGTVCSFGAGIGGLVGMAGNGISMVSQSASIASDIAAEAHAIPEPPAWFRLTTGLVSMAGGLASAGGGASGGTTAAARAASSAVQAAVKATMEGARAGTLAVQAASQAVSAGYTFAADGQQAEGEVHKRSVSRLHEETDDVFEAMKQVMQLARRGLERASNAAREENEHRNGVVRNFARA